MGRSTGAAPCELLNALVRQAEQLSGIADAQPKLLGEDPNGVPGGGLSMLLLLRRSLPGRFVAGQGAACLGASFTRSTSAARSESSTNSPRASRIRLRA